MQYKVINNFSRGIIDSDFSMRDDIPEVENSVSVAKNCYASVSGVMSKRPGTLFHSFPHNTSFNFHRLFTMNKLDGSSYLFLMGETVIEVWEVESKEKIVYKTTLMNWNCLATYIPSIQSCFNEDAIFFFSREWAPKIIDCTKSNPVEWQIADFTPDGPYGSPVSYKASDVIGATAFTWGKISAVDANQPSIGTVYKIKAVAVTSPGTEVPFFDKDTDVGRCMFFYKGTLDSSSENFLKEVFDSGKYAAGIIESVEDPEVGETLTKTVNFKWTRPPLADVTGWDSGSVSSEAYIGVFGKDTLTEGTTDRGDDIRGKGFPGAVGFYQQRMVLGGTKLLPGTIWGSALAVWDVQDAGAMIYSVQTDNSFHFWKYISLAIAPDDMSYSFTIKSRQSSSIQWINQAQDLIVGTQEGEYNINGGGGTEDIGITPRKVSIIKESNFGSSDIKPIFVDRFLLFVQTAPYRLLSIYPSSVRSSYITSYFDIMNSRIFYPGKQIKELVYSRGPVPYVIVVDTSGKLTVITINTSLDTMSASTSGWFEYDTQGEFLSCIVTDKENERSVFFLIKRDGKFYIESFVENHYKASDDLIFSDCSLQQKQDVATYDISGLEFLNGKKVVVVGDGNVMASTTVSNGRIKLPVKVYNAIVGLSYKMKMVLNHFYPEVGVNFQRFPGIGMKSQPIKGSIKLLQTKVCNYGVDEKVKKITLRENLNKDMVFFSGYKDLILPSSMKKEQKVWFSSDDPVPLNIQTIGIYIRS